MRLRTFHRLAFAIGLATFVAGFVPAVEGDKIAHADDARPWLGVELAPRKDAGAGVLVRHVVRSSPADKAGIKDGEIITQIGTKSVSAPGDVIGEVRTHSVGDNLALTIERGGHSVSATVTLAVFPGAEEMLRADKLNVFAPSITGLEGVQGQTPSTIAQLRGKVVVLDFWAGWCGVCKLVTPNLNGWNSKFSSRGLVMIGVSSDAHDVAVKATKSFGIDYNVAIDKDQSVFPGYGVTALPTLYVIDKGGVVRSIEVGFDQAQLRETEALIEKLLAEKAPLAPRALIRVVSEFLWVLRREGLAIGTPQAIDAARAIALVGWSSKEAVRDALATVLVLRPADRALFDRVFDRFFDGSARHERDVRGRLIDRGIPEAHLDALVALLRAALALGDDGEAALALALLTSTSEVSRLLLSSGVSRLLEPLTNGLQVGYFAQTVATRLGVPKVRGLLARLRPQLVDSLGEMAADALLDEILKETQTVPAAIRRFVADTLAAKTNPVSGSQGERRARDVLFAALAPDEIAEVRRAVRVLGERLRGAARVKERHASRGRIDVGRTIRAAFRTGGVPMRALRKRRRRDRPKLFLLCDISDSVRAAATFMLELSYLVQELFERTRTFVFVSEIAETSALFASFSMPIALAAAYSGDVVPVTHNSNYGRALRSFEERFGSAIDKRTTIVIVGDGRTNHQAPEVEIVARLRERSRALLWLCPEPRDRWGAGDSAMALYAREATEVVAASTAAELEQAARKLLARR